MHQTMHLYFYLVLPLLFACTGLGIMWLIVGHHLQHLPAQALVGSITLLLALLPILFFRYFVHSQLQQGFARLNNDQIKLPEELSLGSLLGDQIDSWIPANQLVETTTCLYGENEHLYVKITVHISISADKYGKHFVEGLDKNIPLLIKKIQHAIYSASRMDPDMVMSLNGSTLLNEDDEAVLRSKFLSALETIAIQGVTFPVDTDGIHIDRQVRKEKLQSIKTADQEEKLDLTLDDSLLRSLGVG